MRIRGLHRPSLLLRLHAVPTRRLHSRDSGPSRRAGCRGLPPSIPATPAPRPPDAAVEGGGDCEADERPPQRTTPLQLTSRVLTRLRNSTCWAAVDPASDATVAEEVVFSQAASANKIATSRAWRDRTASRRPGAEPSVPSPTPEAPSPLSSWPSSTSFTTCRAIVTPAKLRTNRHTHGHPHRHGHPH